MRAFLAIPLPDDVRRAAVAAKRILAGTGAGGSHDHEEASYALEREEAV